MPEVWGLETTAEAVAAAQETARELGAADRVRFAAGDATRALSPEGQEPSADDGDAPAGLPEAVVVNPPRRGIGADLSAALEASGIPTVLYSSCNPRTLAQDLARMPSYRAERVRVFDMFPQTPHTEVMVRLERR